MSPTTGTRSTIVLLGPTSAGKTPLGERLARCGLWGQRVVHLDFGRQLRALAAGKWRVAALSAEDAAIVRAVLEQGALFENETFHIPHRIVQAFLREAGGGPDDLLVLNGLPRHVDQAADLDRLLHVAGVIHLDCDAATVAARIRSNAGGDRTGRADDDPALVARKLAVFHERTAPLLDHYRRKGVSVWTFEIGPATTPDELADHIARSIPPP